MEYRDIDNSFSKDDTNIQLSVEPLLFSDPTPSLEDLFLPPTPPAPTTVSSPLPPHTTAPFLTKEDARKLRNRESAAKSRQRAQETIRALEAKLLAVQHWHKFLKSDVQRLMDELGVAAIAPATMVS